MRFKMNCPDCHHVGLMMKFQASIPGKACTTPDVTREGKEKGGSGLDPYSPTTFLKVLNTKCGKV